MVGSKHILSSISSSSSNFATNRRIDNKKSKRSITDSLVSNEDDAVQTFRDDPSTLQAMTLQQLRTMSRNFGISARGSKHDLVLALKCFLDNEKDGGVHAQNPDFVSEISGKEQIKGRGKPLSIDVDIEGNPSKRRARDSSDGSHSQNPKLASQHKKRKGKLPTAHATVSSETLMVKQKLSVDTDEVSDTKPSPARRTGSSRTGNEDGGSTDGVGLFGNLSEPWTVLTHKKPQQGWVPYNPRTMRPQLADGMDFVKLISWNVNGLRALMKLEGISAFAKNENFDVLCLQETKLQEKDVEKIKQCLIDGYENSFWTCSVSKLGYSGTAIISRIKPLSVRYGLGILDHDTEGRLVTVEFDTFYLISGYVPNSGDGLKRLTYRVTQWDPSLGNYMKELEKSKPVILTGDLNCAHQEIDIFNPAGNRRSAGFTNEERESFETNFLSKGFVDTFRRQHPGVVGYTYWGYRHNGRATNKGWRLDYFLVSESIANKVHDSYILPNVIGSDHCPIGLIFKL